MTSSHSKISNVTKIMGFLMLVPLMTSLVTINYQDAMGATDPDIECLGGKTLVYRYFHNDHVCVEQSTAARWVQLNVAEIVSGPQSLPAEVLEQQRERGMRCSTGTVEMSFPDHDTTICVNQIAVPRAMSMGWIPPEDFDMSPTITRGSDPEQICRSGNVVLQNVDSGHIICRNQIEYEKIAGPQWEVISEVPNFEIDKPFCDARFITMMNDEGEELCVRKDKQRVAEEYGLVFADTNRQSFLEKTLAAQEERRLECKSGRISMENPNNGDQICINRIEVRKFKELGWVPVDEIRLDPTITRGSDPNQICRSGTAILKNPNTDAIICRNPSNAQALIEQGWVRVDKQDKQVSSGTVQSMRDPGLGHEGKNIAFVLEPENTVKVGQVTWTSSEPIHIAILNGPIDPREAEGQQAWTRDGRTFWALTVAEQGRSSGSLEFVGNALAFGTASGSPFTVTHTTTYHSLPEGERDDGLISSGTVTSQPDPGVGHEGHSLAIILSPSEDPFYDGVISYSASEPVQMVALHGPLTSNEVQGQPTWTPDGETFFGLTLVDEGVSSGLWEFSGNALAAHTMNPDGFTITYSLATRR